MPATEIELVREREHNYVDINIDNDIIVSGMVMS